MKAKLFTALMASAVLLSQHAEVAAAGAAAGAALADQPSQSSTVSSPSQVARVKGLSFQDIRNVSLTEATQLIRRLNTNYEWIQYYEMYDRIIHPGYLAALYGILSTDHNVNDYKTALSILLLGNGFGGVDQTHPAQKNSLTESVAILAAFLAGVHNSYSSNIISSTPKPTPHFSIMKKYMVLGARFNKVSTKSAVAAILDPRVNDFREFLDHVNILGKQFGFKDASEFLNYYIEMVNSK